MGGKGKGRSQGQEGGKGEADFGLEIGTYWEGLHCFDVFSRCFGGLGVGVVELGSPCEVSITVRQAGRTKRTGGSLLRRRVIAVPSRATDNLLH